MLALITGGIRLCFKPDMTVASIFDVNPRAAQVLFRLGVRSLLSPFVINETLENLSQQFDFDLEQAMDELNKMIPLTANPGNPGDFTI